MSGKETEGKPRYESGMRRFDFTALVYESAHALAALLLGAGLAGVNFFVVKWLDLLENPATPYVNLVVLFIIGSAVVIWAASYYPQKIMVYPDRIRFKMMLGSRDLPAEGIESVAALSPEEARWALFSVRYVSLSTAVAGSVAVRRRRGRPWVFCPEDTEAFIAAAAKMMGERPAEVGPAEVGPEGRSR
jgi:hypothetical protein